jgi:hypothetical protein
MFSRRNRAACSELRLTGRYKENLIQPQLDLYLTGNRQMPVMDRVKGTPQHPYLHIELTLIQTPTDYPR